MESLSHSNMRCTFHRPGFTLIEVLVVIAIILTLTVMSVEGFHAFSTQPATETGTRTVLSAIETAYARTLSADNGTNYGVHFDTNMVTVFPGDTYTAGGADNTDFVLKRAQVSTISLTGGASDVVFARLRGTASATGTVTITNNADVTQTRTVIIHQSGLAEVQ